eukprot:CAMPEP_0178466896 /NCGR_PEP_ID=MMETSP0689_2-20121128/52137_1 /TAXON_ID=160604 /ORGANISM="Amphidinium massartii, Strain CS-259" /LENGTH=67 /DNA_ID=CAMNT_0020093929 /DNA_START=298 /DNA_END=501 /DNA_ORIENTATION=-
MCLAWSATALKLEWPSLTGSDLLQKTASDVIIVFTSMKDEQRRSEAHVTGSSGAKRAAMSKPRVIKL